MYVDRPIPKEKYSAVKLAGRLKDMAPTGMSISTTGYGRLGEQGARATHLMKASLLVKPFQCAVREHEFYRRFLSDPVQVCVRSVVWPIRGQTDACYRDSGGPLF